MNVVLLWIESLQAAYALAYGERLSTLRGRHMRSFDDRGLHPFSELWGVVRACEALDPLLGSQDVATSAQALRNAGREDADAAFRAEVLADVERSAGNFPSEETSSVAVPGSAERQEAAA